MNYISSDEGNLAGALKNNSEQLIQWVHLPFATFNRFACFAIDNSLYYISLCKLIPDADSPK